MSHINCGGERVSVLFGPCLSGFPGLNFGDIQSPRQGADSIGDRERRWTASRFGRGRAYPTTTLESVWIPDPLPAVIHGCFAAQYPRPAASGCRRTVARARNAIAGASFSTMIGLLSYSVELWIRPFVSLTTSCIGCEML